MIHAGVSPKQGCQRGFVSFVWCSVSVCVCVCVWVCVCVCVCLWRYLHILTHLTLPFLTGCAVFVLVLLPLYFCVEEGCLSCVEVVCSPLWVVVRGAGDASPHPLLLLLSTHLLFLHRAVLLDYGVLVFLAPCHTGRG